MFDYTDTVKWLLTQPMECEWVEFKLNHQSGEDIGKRISALANGACLYKQPFGYIVFGINDVTHEIVGTTFNAANEKVGNELVEHWINQRLNPKIDFTIHTFQIEEKRIVLIEIASAKNQPIEFTNVAYVRIGSVTRKINDFPDKQRRIWMNNPSTSFVKDIAQRNVTSAEIIELLETQHFFEMMKLPYPSDRVGTIERFLSEELIVEDRSNYSITNLGAILYAKDLSNFPTIARKAPRLIIYEGINKLKTVRDIIGMKGYAAAFKPLIDYINGQLPANEEISKVIRESVNMYPLDAIRELVANALIHQDFTEAGTGPMIEIYADRIEITNPGLPLITPLRFIDEYQSRNEELASHMRRIGICEEKGSGIDRVVSLSELYQLPAPDFRTLEKHTKAIMYAYKKLGNMDKQDKIRACYQHCCLKYVSNGYMTNQTLRGRFKIEDQNSAIASRIIGDTLEAKLIKLEDVTSKSKKHMKYIPIWA